MCLENFKSNLRNAYCLSDHCGCLLAVFFFFVFVEDKNNLIDLCQQEMLGFSSVLPCGIVQDVGF